MIRELGRDIPWCLSYLAAYVRELGRVINTGVHGVKYVVVEKDGSMELVCLELVCLEWNMTGMNGRILMSNRE